MHTSNHTVMDYEQLNFNLLDDTTSANDYIIHPDTCAYTNDRRIEVTLLKIVTEMEAPSGRLMP